MGFSRDGSVNPELQFLFKVSAVPKVREISMPQIQSRGGIDTIKYHT